MLPKLKNGFTLIELLIVIAILAILMLAVLMTLANLGKARDGKRKSDLTRIQTAFEEYYVDHNEYPPESVLSDCGGDALAPYLKAMPCDPRTKTPYCYVYDTDSNGRSYHVLASLENKNDDIITQIGCYTENYCGYENECQAFGSRFDYSIASSNSLRYNPTPTSFTPTPTPSSTTAPSPTTGPFPSTIPGAYACAPDRVCNNYGSLPNAISSGCPVTWNVDTCGGYCGSAPAYALCTH